jgi:hypothetical protein
MSIKSTPDDSYMATESDPLHFHSPIRCSQVSSWENNGPACTSYLLLEFSLALLTYKIVPIFAHVTGPWPSVFCHKDEG